MEMLAFDPANLYRFAAAYTFRFNDLHTAASSKFTEDFAYFAKQLVFLESTDDSRYVLWADMTNVVPAVIVTPFAATAIASFQIDPVDVDVTVYVQTRAEVEAGDDPTAGISITFRISSGGQPITYTLGVYPDDAGKLEIAPTALDDAGAASAAGAHKTPVPQSTEFFLGAKRDRTSASLTVTPQNAAPEVLAWITSSFPEFETAILSTLFADVRLIQDVSNNVVKNVKLVGPVESYWEEASPGWFQIVVGAERAALHAPDCPVNFSQAYIDPHDLQTSQNGVAIAGDQITFPPVKISEKKLVSGYNLAAFPPAFTLPRFSLWMRRSLLEKSFDVRLGKNIGAMLGAHYHDRKGPIKYWLAGAWILEGIQGSLQINANPQNIASMDLRFDGRTKFDAMAYVDIGCFTYELGSFDGFHENFDFTLSSKVYFNAEAKLVFVGGFENIDFDKWRSFIRTFLDRWITSWQGIAIEIVAKFIIGQYIRMFIEGEITKAMGCMSLELLEAEDIPIFGDLLKPFLTPGHGANLAAKAESLGEGVLISIGAAG